MTLIILFNFYIVGQRHNSDAIGIPNFILFFLFSFTTLYSLPYPTPNCSPHLSLETLQQSNGGCVWHLFWLLSNELLALTSYLVFGSLIGMEFTPTFMVTLVENCQMLLTPLHLPNQLFNCQFSICIYKRRIRIEEEERIL